MRCGVVNLDDLSTSISNVKLVDFGGWVQTLSRNYACDESIDDAELDDELSMLDEELGALDVDEHGPQS